MKRVLLVLSILLLSLSACSLSKTPATPSTDVIELAVAQTLTAYPSQTPFIVTPTLSEEAPLAEWPTPTNTPPSAPGAPSAPSAPSVIYVYPTQIVYPTPIVYPTAAVYPTAVPYWAPYYADQFIYYYYQRINARDYSTSWSYLTDAFKAAVNPTGYTDYVNFWNSVSRVDISYVSVNSLSGSYATVVAGIVYNYSNGLVTSSNQTFHLYYDSWRGSWLFDSAAAAAAVVPPTAVPAVTYPSDFIYYYFNNINARNYPLTWSLLTSSFIAHNNPTGYTDYVNFWNSVNLVQITYVTVNSFSGSYADVTVGMTLNYSNGLVTNSSPRFYLVYNSGIGNWQFYSP